MSREQTKEAIQIMQSWVDGKEVQVRGLLAGSVWMSVSAPCWNWQLMEYRIKPTATLRPWTADEVPLGSIMRAKGLEGRCIIVATETSDDRAYWLNAREHSTDGGKTWLPCGVVEEAK